MNVQAASIAKWSVYKAAAEAAQLFFDYDAAELNWLAALEEAEGLPPGKSIVVTLENLASVYFTMGKLAQAAPLMRRVLRIYQDNMGEDHADVAVIANNLAILYHSWEKFPDAAQYYNLALSIKGKLVKATDPQIVQLKAGLSAALNEMSRRNIGQWLISDTCTRASETQEEADRTDLREELAPKSGDTARTLGWKTIFEGATFAKKRKDFANSEKLYERALKAAERRHGIDHIVVAYISLEFADLHFSQKNYEQAQALYNRAGMILTNHVQSTEG
jgi:tetratricopeptide (TPR) repeat protein